MEKKKVTLVIPMYYEEKVAEECYKRVKENLVKLENYDHEIIFVNDGSKDKTLEILEDIAKKDTDVKVISFSRNFGHQAAVTAGLQYVTGDAIVIMDADLQDPPELIPDMLKLWEEGNDTPNMLSCNFKNSFGRSEFHNMRAHQDFRTPCMDLLDEVLLHLDCRRINRDLIRLYIKHIPHNITKGCTRRRS